MKLLDDISHECCNELVYKHPRESFTYLTVLHVGINQTAVFERDGIIADVLGPGRYVLSPENIPLLTGILQRFSQNRSSVFRAHVYFFSTSNIPNLKFGTSLTIREHMDRRLVSEGIGMIPVKAGVYGKYYLRISNPVLLLKALLADRISLDRRYIEQYFRSLLISRIVPVLRKIIKREQISIFELEEYLEEFSLEAQRIVGTYFEEIGLNLLYLNIEGFSAESDPAYIQLRELLLSESMILSKASTDARANRILGTTYQEREEFRILGNLSQRSSADKAANAGIDFGTMRAMSDLFYRHLKNRWNPDDREDQE